MIFDFFNRQPSIGNEKPAVAALASRMDEVVIIGGGFAGLAAGAALAEAGARVRLLEQKPHLGGRARSFVEPATGSVVDNGQHIVMGCYHATLKFLSTIGTLERVSFQPNLTVWFAEPGGRLTSLKCGRWPAPWHLVWGVMRSRSFAAREKLEVLRLGRALKSERAAGLDGNRRLTVDEWLKGLGQSESLRRNFWDLLCIAAMNEDPAIASAALFERVLRLALFSSPDDSRLGLCRAGLSDCYTQAAADFITRSGGRVELERNAVKLEISSGACQGAVLADGEKIEARTVLAAVPCFEFVKLVPDHLLRSEPLFTNLLSLRPAPIISINLWLDRAITDLDFAGMRGTTMQWLFNKSKIFGTDDHYVSLVLSGAHEHIKRSKEELLGVALRDLGELFPASAGAKLLHSLIIKERYATFSPHSDAEDVRPPARTPIRGLYLAGDWTATGLPATIEGAVKSGYTAAQEILRD